MNHIGMCLLTNVIITELTDLVCLIIQFVSYWNLYSYVLYPLAKGELFLWLY